MDWGDDPKTAENLVYGSIGYYLGYEAGGVANGVQAANWAVDVMSGKSVIASPPNFDEWVGITPEDKPETKEQAKAADEAEAAARRSSAGSQGTMTPEQGRQDSEATDAFIDVLHRDMTADQLAKGIPVDKQPIVAKRYDATHYQLGTIDRQGNFDPITDPIEGEIPAQAYTYSRPNAELPPEIFPPVEWGPPRSMPGPRSSGGPTLLEILTGMYGGETGPTAPPPIEDLTPFVIDGGGSPSYAGGSGGAPPMSPLNGATGAPTDYGISLTSPLGAPPTMLGVGAFLETALPTGTWQRGAVEGAATFVVSNHPLGRLALFGISAYDKLTAPGDLDSGRAADFYNENLNPFYQIITTGIRAEAAVESNNDEEVAKIGVMTLLNLVTMLVAGRAIGGSGLGRGEPPPGEKVPPGESGGGVSTDSARGLAPLGESETPASGGNLEVFENKLASRLPKEQADAARVGAKPISPGHRAFARVANQGTIKWVVLESGDLVVAEHTVGGTEISHAVLSGGKGVLAAGQAEVAIVNGKVFGIQINNHSGHFLPSIESLDIGRRAFASWGVTFP